MKKQMVLQDYPHTWDYLNVSEGEYCGIVNDIADLQDILPIVLTATEAPETNELMRSALIIGYVIGHLKEMKDEMEKGAKA